MHFIVICTKRSIHFTLSGKYQPLVNQVVNHEGSLGTPQKIFPGLDVLELPVFQLIHELHL